MLIGFAAFWSFYKVSIRAASRRYKKATQLFLLFPQASADDSTNFDKDFTMEKPLLTPIDGNLLKTINQNVFKGFSFTNPAAEISIDSSAAVSG